MSKLQELIDKYHLQRNSYYPEDFLPYRDTSPEDQKIMRERTRQLQQKYAAYIPKGWYGFLGLGAPTAITWFDVIEEYIDHLLQSSPDLEILQVKVKFGGIRMYLGKITKEQQEELSTLTNLLHDDKLIF